MGYIGFWCSIPDVSRPFPINYSSQHKYFENSYSDNLPRTTEGISDNGDTSCVPDSYYDTLSVFFSDDDITASYICIEHTAYWLVMGKPQSCERGGVSCNVPSILATVPGISKLDGNYFGGLTKEDLVTRYVL